MPTLSDYRHLSTGKVRELYEVDDELLLMVATDRISAYDYVLPSPIPDKGRVLTATSVFFFDLLSDVVPNHLVAYDDPRIPAEVRGRALLVRRLDMLPVECVARGYLTGSGLTDYQATGEVCGIPLPEGLEDGSRLSEAIFTPATKADLGEHDENVSYAAMVSTTAAYDTFSSCSPRSALVAGVKIGSGSSEPSSSPGGSPTPQTAPVAR